MTRFAPRAVVLCFVALGAFASAAAADPAPIVYAGQSAGPRLSQTASLSAGLAGGDENSYGYGASQRRGGAVIDLRRPSAAAPPSEPQAPQPVRAAPPPEQGASPPDWLERERVGPPYEANGRWYVPTPEPGYSESGSASWYGPQFHGQRTASGEVFDQEALTAAHPTLPIPSLVQVTNLENGREIIVRVNDRGPFVGERLIDLSHGAATVLGFEQAGHAQVHVRYLGPAPRRVNADGTPAPASLRAAPASPPAPAGAEEEHAHGHRRTLEHRADLLHRQVLGVAQPQGGALLGAQDARGGLPQRLALVALGRGVRRVHARGHAPELEFAAGLARFLAARALGAHAQTLGNGVQPRGEAPAAPARLQPK